MNGESQKPNLDFFSYGSEKFLECLPCNFHIEFDKKHALSDILSSRELIVTYDSELDTGYALFLKKIGSYLSRISRQAGKGARIILKPDSEITRQELETHSFIILDTPRSGVFEEYLPELPVRIDGHRMTGGGGKFEGANLQAVISIPNPFNSRELFIVVRGTSRFPLYLMSGFKFLNVPYQHSISRISAGLKIIENGCLEFNNKANRIEFLIGNNYSDDNDWICVRSNNLVICVKPGSAAEKDTERLIMLHREAFDEVVARLGLTPKQNDLYMCFVSEHGNEDFEKDHGEKITETAGLYNETNRELHTIYNNVISETQYLSLNHELVHAIAHSSLGGNIPHFLNEGLAMYLYWNRQKDIEFYACEMLRSGALSPISSLLDDDTFKEKHSFDMYNQAASFVEFLVTRYSVKRFYALVRMIGLKSREPEDSAKTLYGKTVTELEKEWRTAIVSSFQSRREELEGKTHWDSACRHYFYKEYSAALADLERAVKKNDKNPYVHGLAGLCQFLLGDLISATESFLKTLSLPLANTGNDKLHSRSCLHLGKIFDIRGEREKALQYYDLVIKKGKFRNFCEEAEAYMAVPYEKKP